MWRKKDNAMFERSLIREYINSPESRCASYRSGRRIPAFNGSRMINVIIFIRYKAKIFSLTDRANLSHGLPVSVFYLMEWAYKHVTSYYTSPVRTA